MALRGSVRAFSLDQLLTFLSASGHRGSLSIFLAEARKTLYLHQGGLYFERSNWSFRLGDVLVRRAEISHEQLAEAIAEQQRRSGEPRLGVILVELGYTTGERILTARRFQVEEEIYELFGWEDAFFEFTKDSLPAEFEKRLESDPEEFRFEVTSVLMEAARRLDEWHNIRDKLPSEKRLLVLSEREGSWERSTTGLVTAGARVATPDDVFGGKVTVAELPRALGLSRFESQSLATRLIQAGDVRPLQRHELETRFRTALETDLPYAIALYECALETPEFEPRGRFLDRVLFGCAQFREKAPGGLAVSARVSGKRAFEILLALFRQAIPCEYGAREEDRAHVLVVGKSALVWRIAAGKPPPNILNRLLLKHPIPEADLARVREMQREAGRSLQQILVGGGFVTMETWFRAQKDALLDELFGIFFLRRPFMDVKTGEPARQPGASGALDIEVPLLPWLQAEVMREIRQWETMLGAIPSVRAVFQLTPKGEKSIVGPEDLLRQFDGQRSLEEIMAGQTRPPPEFFAWVYERIEGGRLRALDAEEYKQRLDDAVEHKRRAQAMAYCVAGLEASADPGHFRERLKTLQTAEVEISLEPSRHTLRGDLASFSLPEVLQSLFMSKRSGTLRVELKTQVEVKARQLYFDRGEVYLLAGDQELTEDDLVDGLIVGGNLTEDQIASAAASQMKDEVYEIFLWEGAEFEFAADHHPREFTHASSRRKVRLNSRGFLMEAVRRITEWEEVRRILPSDDVVLEFSGADAKMRAISHKGELKDLLLLVDGRHPIADLVRISGVHRFKGVRVLAELAQDGLLRPVDVTKKDADDERAFTASNLPTSGVIEPGFVGQLQFVGTLQDLASASLTGVLRLTDGRRSKEMALVEGAPYRTQPYRPRDPKLAEQNGAALRAESTKDVAEDVSECFSWQATRFELLVGTLPPRLADERTRTPFALEPELFFDTFAQCGERWGLVAELVPRDRSIGYTSDDAKETAKRKAGEDARIADLIDGKRSPEEVARLSGRRYAAMSLIAGLFEEGLLETVDPPAAEAGEEWDLNL